MTTSNFKAPKLVLTFNGARVLVSISRSMHIVSQKTGSSLQAISYCCSGKYIATRGFYYRLLHPDVEIEISDIDNLRLEEYDKMCGEQRKYYTVREMAHRRERWLAMNPYSLKNRKNKEQEPENKNDNER